MSSQPKDQANRRPAVQRSKIGDPGIPSTVKGLTPEHAGEPPALIAVVGYVGCGKTTFVNRVSGSHLKKARDHGIRASNEFELDGQRVVLIDTPGMQQYHSKVGRKDKGVIISIGEFLAESYPTGTNLAGIICVHKITQLAGTHSWEWWLLGNAEELKELCGDATLKNLVIMTHDWKKVSPTDVDGMKRYFPRQYSIAIREGVQVYHCTNTSELDLGALRIILEGRPVVPKVQQEPINKGNKPEQRAVATELRQEITDLAEKHDSDTNKRSEESVQGAVNERVEELRRELEEEKRRAQEEADGLKKRIAEMQLEERIRKESFQELEERERRAREEADTLKKQIAEMQSKEEITRKEMERRAREEADGLRKRIAEMQSKPEEDRHRSGKASATYSNSRHVPSHPI